MNNKCRIKDTQLVCMNCGNVVVIQRLIRNLKTVGHIKHFYCYRCNSIQAHYEVKDVSTFIWKCNNRGMTNLDENSRLVFDLLMRREDNYERETDKLYRRILTKE